RHRLQEEDGISVLDLEVTDSGDAQAWRGTGKGPLEALVAALPVSVEVMDYSEHAIGAGSQAQAAAYIELRLDGGRSLHGIGIDGNLATAGSRALAGALNRARAQVGGQPA